MAYVQLAVQMPAFPNVEAFVRDCVENLHFKDVHAMLRLPLTENGISAGCNFAITHVLLAAVSGISATLYTQARMGEFGGAFKNLLVDFYPWKLEGNAPLAPEKIEEYANLLWKEFRCSLSHRLGVAVSDDRRSAPQLSPRSYTLKIKRISGGGNGLKEEDIEALERGAIWPFPDMMTTTFSDRFDAKVLKVERFYWGLRRMLEDLCASEVRMRDAEAFLVSPALASVSTT